MLAKGMFSCVVCETPEQPKLWKNRKNKKQKKQQGFIRQVKTEQHEDASLFACILFACLVTQNRFPFLYSQGNFLQACVRPTFCVLLCFFCNTMRQPTKYNVHCSANKIHTTASTLHFFRQNMVAAAVVFTLFFVFLWLCIFKMSNKWKSKIYFFYVFFLWHLKVHT